MFGIYRTLLAVSVVADHYWPVNGAGAVAVFGFYSLSGFLMTLLMSGAYRGRPFDFLINRVLRLYPMYFATFMLTMFVGLAIPMVAGVAVPIDRFTFAREMFYWVRLEDARIVPTAWAVTNEIVFYVLIACGLSRTLKRSIAWLLASVLLNIGLATSYGTTLVDLYFPVWGASLPFAAGAVLAHLRDRLPVLSPLAAVAGLALCATATMTVMANAGDLVYPVEGQWRLMLCLYASLIPALATVAILYRLDYPKWRPADEAIGLYSYPIYLVQFIAGEMVVAEWFPFMMDYGRFPSTMLLTTIIAAIWLALIEPPIREIRRYVRTDGAFREFLAFKKS